MHVFPTNIDFATSARFAFSGRRLAFEPDEADLLHSNLTAHFIGAWSARMTEVPELWHLHDYPFKFKPVHAINRLIGAGFLFVYNRV